MKHTEKKLKAAVLLLLLTCSSVFAQNMDELGVVWDRTYGTGYINSLKPVIAVAGGHGYVAAGREWNSATTPGIDRCAGLLIEIDESGNEIRRATATIPQTYITAHNNNLARAEAEFVFAFKTSDGGYLAFDVLGDFNAPGSEKSGVGVRIVSMTPPISRMAYGLLNSTASCKSYRIHWCGEGLLMLASNYLMAGLLLAVIPKRRISECTIARRENRPAPGI